MNLFELLVKGLIWATLICSIGLIVRKSSAAQRHSVWLVATVGLSLLPLVLLAAPRWKLTVRTEGGVGSVSSELSHQGMSFSDYEVGRAAAIPASGLAVPTGPEETRSVDWETVFVIGWVVVASALIVRQCLGLLVACLLVARSRAYMVREGIPVRLSYRLQTPSTVGKFRPVVLLPAEAQQWSSHRIELVLAHEMAHVRRSDWFWINLAGFMVAIHALNPLAWLVAARLRTESEFACDDAVLAAGYSGDRYAEELLAIARLVNRRLLESAALGMARRQGLKDRILAIQDGRRARDFSRRGVLNVGLWAGLLVGLTLAACQVVGQEMRGTLDSGVAGIAMNPSNAPIWKGAEAVDVTDASGNPMEHARVAIMFLGGFWAGYGTETAPLVTDAHGVCKFSNADFEPQTAKGTPVEAVVFAEGHAISIGPIPSKGLRAHVTVSAPSSAQLRFVDEQGSPVTGVRVKIRDLWLDDHVSQITVPQQWRASQFGGVTDGRGLVRFDDLPAHCKIGVEARHPEFVSVISQAPAIGDRVDVGPLSIPGPGADTQATTVRLTRAGHLFGAVTSNGVPVRNVQITATLEGANGGVPAKTDSQGGYRFPGLRPGRYSIKVYEAPEGLVFRPYLKVAVEGQSELELNFKGEHGGLVSGKVRYEDGSIPDRLIQLELSGPGYPATDDKQLVDVDQGRFTVRAPSGSYNVYMLDGSSPDPIAAAKLVKSLRLEEGKETPVEIVLPTPPGPPPATSEVSAFRSEEKPIYGPVKLNDGHTARVAFVQTDGAEPWAPNGSVASAADIARAIDFNSAPAKPGANRAIYVRVDVDEPRDDVNCIVQAPHRSEWTCWQSYGDQEGHALDMATFRAPSVVKTSDLRLGIGHGAFRSVLREPIGGTVLRADVSSSPGYIRVFIPRRYLDLDVQLVAYDQKGTSYRTSMGPSLQPGSEPTSGFAYQFCGIAAGDVRSLELKVRPWDWVTFTGLQLWPNGSR